MKFAKVGCLALLVMAILSANPLNAQLLYNPESVVFDSANNRYLVSNWGDGNIVQIDSAGNQSYFSTAPTRLAALHIIGNTLLVASNLDPYVGLLSFDMATATITGYIPFADAGLPNDIDNDTSGNVYVTDFYNSRIYKVNLSAQSYTVFVNSGLDMPNGIVFDKRHNRLLVACQNEPGRPIKAISVEDSSVSVVVYTGLSGVDGLALDNQNRLLFSSWQSNCVHRYDTAFAEPPEVVSSGHSGPADIYINRCDYILCVPNFYYHTVDFIQLEPSAVDQIGLPGGFIVSQNYPNPFNVSTIIEYNLPEASDIRLDIYDVLGRMVATLMNQRQPAGIHRLIWQATNNPSGVYFYRIQTGDYIETKKMLLLK
jgi:sugar lactone lactonase YvrE